MTSEFALDYRFAVESPADAHYAHALVDLMEGGHNPIRLACDQSGATHSGRFRMRAFGDIGLMECQLGSPGGGTLFIGERTRSHISRNQSFGFHISIWLEGENMFSIGGRTHTCQPGDFIVMDTETPYYSEVRNRGHAYNIALPATWDRIGDIRVENILGGAYLARERRYNALVSYARHLIARPNALAEASEKLYDVVALAFNPRATSEHQTGLVTLIRNHIDRHCANPNFDPASVAVVFGISVRHLHRLFAASGATFTEYLLEQRLAQARRMLSDVRHRQQTVLNIAFSCGFRDINHFGRRFRARYGITPGEFREVSLMARIPSQINSAASRGDNVVSVDLPIG